MKMVTIDFYQLKKFVFKKMYFKGLISDYPPKKIIFVIVAESTVNDNYGAL